MTLLAVMGAGLIGSRHVNLIQESPNCDLACVVDPNTALQTDADVQYFQNLDELPDDLRADIKGIVIATPTGLHLEHGLAAAERGWHILMEKPVCATPSEAPSLAAACKEAGVHCLVGHHRRYHPAVQQLKQLLADGGIGTPVTSTLIWAMKKPDDYFAENWRTTDGSPVMINLIHDIDLMRFVLGEVTDMVALGSNAMRGAARTESGAIALRFENNLTATISFADTTPSPWGFEAGMGENPNIATTKQDMWWITGTKGGVSFPSLTQWAGAPDWGHAPEPRALEVNTVTPLAAQLNHFIDVINGIAEPIITVEDAAKSLAVTRAIEDMLTPKQENPS